MTPNRRETLWAAGGATLLAGLPARAAAAEAAEASPTNLLAARVLASTVVTPAFELSVRFYRDVLLHRLVGEGRLGRMGSSPGEFAGRRYALFRVPTLKPAEGGLIRLLEAPPGALPNRPPPNQAIMDDGYVALEAIVGDDEQMFRNVKAAGFQTVSDSLFYHQDGVDPPPGVKPGWDYGDIEVKTFAAIGPGGEMLLMTRGITLGGAAWPKWEQPTPMGAFGGGVLVMRDRWPVQRFYSQALGVRIAKTQYLAQDMVNRCIGAPDGTYYYFGNLGQGFGCEWWEFRHDRPFKTAPWPTSLNRTGLAMMTVAVDDLGKVRENVRLAGITPLPSLPLPLVDRDTADSVRLRGPLGELIEIVGRRA